MSKDFSLTSKSALTLGSIGLTASTAVSVLARVGQSGFADGNNGYVLNPSGICAAFSTLLKRGSRPPNQAGGCACQA
jgi:hypothetical protein